MDHPLSLKFTWPQNDSLIILFNDVKVPLDASLEIHQYIRDLGSRQIGNRQRVLVIGVQPGANVLADDADESGGFFKADNVFKQPRKLAYQVGQLRALQSSLKWYRHF